MFWKIQLFLSIIALLMCRLIWIMMVRSGSVELVCVKPVTGTSPAGFFLLGLNSPSVSYPNSVFPTRALFRRLFPQVFSPLIFSLGVKNANLVVAHIAARRSRNTSYIVSQIWQPCWVKISMPRMAAKG